MHIKTVVRCLSRLLITSFATLGVLQPLTIHATSAAEMISGDEPPSTVLVAQPHQVPVPTQPSNVIIDNGGVITTITSSALLVRTVLAEQAIFLGEHDLVLPPLDSHVGPLRSIVITQVSTKESTQRTELAFTTRIQQDPTRTNGVEVVQQNGKTGLITVHSEATLYNGVEVRRQVLSTKQTAPVEQVILHGTRQADVSRGGASWYDGGPGALTAAHRTLPFGTKLLVTNQANGMSVVVTVADRGPFIAGRIIDLSPDSFAKIAGLGSGVVQVSITRL